MFEDQCLVEVVDGRLVMTSLMRRSQPLIRYELGDLAQLDTAPCPCGRSFARLAAVEGRADDVLRLPGPAARPLPCTRSPSAARCRAVPELRRYKVVNDRDGLHVSVELRSGGAEVADRVASLLRRGSRSPARRCDRASRSSNGSPTTTRPASSG